MKASQDAPGQCTNCGVITGVRTDGLCNDCLNAQRDAENNGALAAILMLFGWL